MQKSRNRLPAFIAALGLAPFSGLGLMAPSTASAASAAEAGGLEEIVVTARKKSEELQTVPLAITAFSSADLAKAGVQDLRDITLLTPGVTFYNGAGGNYYSKPIIRGQTDIGGGQGENNVPVFFDGIYISNTSAIDLGLIDIDRVEVIKGPVSATYGRSAYAGAINYVSAKPTDEMKGYAELTGGDYGRFNGRFGIAGPIVPGVLRGNLSASYDAFDGTYHDSATGLNANGYTKRDFLGSLDYQPNEHLEIRPVIYYGDDNFGPQATLSGQANCSVGAGFGFSQSFCGTLPSNFSAPQPAPTNPPVGTLIGPYVASGAGYGQTGNTRTIVMTVLNVNVTYDWGSVTSLTGYDEIKSREYSEFDDSSFGFPSPTFYLPPGAAVGTFPTNPALLGSAPTGMTALTPLHFGFHDKNRDFSEELRYSSPQNQPFRYAVGGFYANSYHYNDLNLAQGTCSVPAGQYIISLFAVPCGTITSPQHTLFTQTSKITAEFIGLDWDVLPSLTLSTEVRNQSQKQEYNDLYGIFDTFGLGYSIGLASSINPLGLTAPLSKTFNSVTSRTSVSWKFTPDVMLYFTAANGEKSGGFNNNTQFPTYDPEKDWTFELGVKSEFLDHTLQVNADIFHINATNYQVAGPPPGATLPGGFINTNYGGLTTNGVELSTIWVPLKGVNFSVGVAYADPKFNSSAYDFGDVALCAGTATSPGPAGCASRIVQVGPNKAVSLDGLRPPYESNLTFNAGIDLRQPINDSWSWLARLDYRYESKQFYQYPIDAGSFGPRNYVNLRAGVETGPVTLTLWVRNLTDDKTPTNVSDSYVSYDSDFRGKGYFVNPLLPDGRTFGATLHYLFGK